jgi:hypothetical protein
MDLLGPLATAEEGNKYIIVITDAWSKYAEIGAIKNKKAETVARAFVDLWVANHGTPELVVTDRGKEFVSKATDELFRILKVKRATTIAFRPQSNAQAEVFNKTIIRYLRTMMENGTLHWELHLPMLKLSYNTQVHKTTLQTPFALTHFYEARLPYFDIDDPKLFYGEDWAQSLVRNWQDICKLANENAEKAKKKQKQFFDRKTRERKFEVGDKVMVFAKNTGAKKGNRKLQRPWDGPWLVTREVGEKTVEVTCMGDPKRRKLILHRDDIRLFNNDYVGLGKGP